MNMYLAGKVLDLMGADTSYGFVGVLRVFKVALVFMDHVWTKGLVRQRYGPWYRVAPLGRGKGR